MASIGALVSLPWRIAVIAIHVVVHAGLAYLAGREFPFAADAPRHERFRFPQWCAQVLDGLVHAGNRAKHAQFLAPWPSFFHFKRKQKQTLINVSLIPEEEFCDAEEPVILCLFDALISPETHCLDRRVRLTLAELVPDKREAPFDWHSALWHAQEVIADQNMTIAHLLGQLEVNGCSQTFDACSGGAFDDYDDELRTLKAQTVASHSALSQLRGSVSAVRADILADCTKAVRQEWEQSANSLRADTKQLVMAHHEHTKQLIVEVRTMSTQHLEDQQRCIQKVPKMFAAIDRNFHALEHNGEDLVTEHTDALASNEVFYAELHACLQDPTCTGRYCASLSEANCDADRLIVVTLPTAVAEQGPSVVQGRSSDDSDGEDFLTHDFDDDLLEDDAANSSYSARLVSAASEIFWSR